MQRTLKCINLQDCEIDEYATVYAPELERVTGREKGVYAPVYATIGRVSKPSVILHHRVPLNSYPNLPLAPWAIEVDEFG